MSPPLHPQKVSRPVLVCALSALLAIGIVGPAWATMGDGSSTGHGGQMMDPTPTYGAAGDMMPGDGAGTMPGGPSDGGTAPGMDGSGHEAMFHDVEQHDWYQPYAEHMAERGFMMGYAGGEFRGYDPITRGQFVAIMARMMGLDPADGSGFTDMHGYWGADMVGAMVEAGLVHGYPDGSFHPYETISRAQMAAVMDRAWERMHGDWVPTADEWDAVHRQLRDIGGMWAEGHITHMYSLGVIHGDGTGHFRPWEATNRAQASAMMWRWYELSQGS